MRLKNVIYALLLITTSSYGQSFDTEFGKNRVQYNDDFKYWSQYESENFITYWYGKGKNTAYTVIQIAEYDHDEIRKQIEHRINDKIEIIVYSDLADLKQSNIGSEELMSGSSGETKIVGTKMLVYFDGNHQNLRRKIKEGIASVYFSSMLFGTNFQEVVQNAVLLDLPVWYKPGFISFAGHSWDIMADDELRNLLFQNEKFYSFKKLADEHPKIAGHSMWNYLKMVYGKSAVANLLYLTRISRNFDNSVEFVLNTNISNIHKEWSNYYKNKYSSLQGKFQKPFGNPFSIKKNKREITNIALSEDGAYALYAINELGKITVFRYDLKTKKSKKIFKKGYKNWFQESDQNYPHFTWMGNQKFTISYLHRDRILIRQYDNETLEYEEQMLPSEIQRIYSISQIDKRYYVFSGAIDGMSDLFLYDAKEREFLRITEDYYDDLDVKVVKEKDGRQGILFSSNRIVDHILPAKIDTLIALDNFDIFYLDLPTDLNTSFELEKMSKTLDRITNTIHINERKPVKSKNGEINYLSDENGVINKYFTKDGEVSAQSNFASHILGHDCNDNEYIYFYRSNKKYYIHHEVLEDIEIINTTNLDVFMEDYKVSRTKSETGKKNKNSSLSKDVPSHLKFQSRFEDIIIENVSDSSKINEKIVEEQITAANLQTNKKSNLAEEYIGKKINYILTTAAGVRYRVDNVTARMDNEVLFEGLELVNGNNTQVNQLPMGFLLKAGLTDVFEDYNLEIGTRISTALDGVEYFLSFENEKKLIDKKFALYLRNFSEREEADYIPPLKSKKQSIIGMYRWKYPFDIYQSVRAYSILRLDKQYFKSTEQITIDEPAIYDKRIGLKLEYVYDNSFSYATNILHGTRIKVYSEIYNRFNFELIDNFDINLSRGFTGVVGFDARHYIPILNHSIIALRATSAVSFGSLLNLYYLGGVNNSIFPSFDRNTSISENQEFAFKSNAPHLRGFDSNIRNGTRYSLLNTEIRIPVFKYLLGKDKGANFFRNFQLVFFGDAGLAWYGSGPYDKANPLNTVSIDDSLIDLEIQYFRDPIVYGYGLGLRTQILGYFVRIDLAKGVETKKSLSQKLHIGVGMDF